MSPNLLAVAVTNEEGSEYTSMGFNYEMAFELFLSYAIPEQLLYVYSIRILNLHLLCPETLVLGKSHYIE